MAASSQEAFSPSPASRVSGQVRRPQRAASAVGGLEQGQLGARRGGSRRAKMRIAFGQALSWSPAGPSRSSRKPGDVRLLDPRATRRWCRYR